MTYGVITICLNARGTIRQAIDSALAQATPPAQYVIVDGGSTDGTLEDVAEARSHAMDRGLPTKFSVISQTEPTGIPGAWNLGLAALRTELVFMLNADDWYEPHAAATVLAAFAQHPDAGIVAGGILLHPDDGGAPRPMLPRSPLLFPVLMPVMHPACFVRRSVYEEIGGFDTHYRISADYDFCYRCHLSGVVFHRLQDRLTNMRAGGRALTGRAQARDETRDVARTHCSVPLLPEFAWFLRRIAGR